MDDEALQILMHHPALWSFMPDQAKLAAAAHDLDLFAPMEDIDDWEVGAVALADIHHRRRDSQIGARPHLDLGVSHASHAHRKRDDETSDQESPGHNDHPSRIPARTPRSAAPTGSGTRFLQGYASIPFRRDLKRAGNLQFPQFVPIFRAWSAPMPLPLSERLKA